MKDLRGDSPSFKPGSGALGTASGGPPDSPRFKFKKFNPNRTFQVKEDKFTPHAAPFTPPAPFAMPELESSLNQMYHPPLHPLQYHLYAPPPQRVKVPKDAHQRTAEDLFINNDLRMTLQERNEVTLQTLVASNLPEYVHVYHSLVPLDTSIQEGEAKSWKYKAISNATGRTVCLMRIENFQLSHEQSMKPINNWNKVKLAGLVGVLEAFTTLAFGDNSLVVVYEYYPLSETLGEHYATAQPEGLIWSIAAQLASTVHQLHKKQLYVRVLNTKTVIVTQKDRVRIGSCAAEDVMALEKRIQEQAAPPELSHLANKDWNDLGQVIFALMSPKLNWQAAQTKYSNDLVAFTKYLMEDEAPAAEKILTTLAPHTLRVLDSALLQNDVLETTLSTELENARLVRLMAKLQFITGRPEHANDSRWQPMGDRYPLLLFMDHAFHQVDEAGKPSLDLAHALQCLNKLDAGVDENVYLVSGDEQSRIIMSYKELKMVVEQVFREARD